MAPNPFLFLSEQGAKGVDCTNIPHVRNVRCARGRCMVERCEDGFSPSSDHSTCICHGENANATPVQQGHQAPVFQWD